MKTLRTIDCHVSYPWSEPVSPENEAGTRSCARAHTHTHESGFQRRSYPWFLLLWAQLRFPSPYSLVAQPIPGFQEPRDASFA